jgi:acyl carrier protein
MVEIVLDVEETFGISLPDERMAEIRTVGELRDCIVEVLEHENTEGDGLTCVIFERLQEALQTVATRRASQEPITPETALSTLFPPIGRRSAWKQLTASLDLPLPPLKRPHWISTIFLLMAVVLGWITSILMLQVLFPVKTAASGWLIGGLGGLLGFAAIFLWWLVGRGLTWPLAVFWPKDVRTVGGLSHYLLQKRYGEVVKKEQRFNREEVWCILQSIIAATLGVNRCDVTPEARFFEDLGAG